MFDKVLKYIVMAGIFLLPFTPLIISTSMFFPFITGKTFALRIIIEIIFAAWVVLAIRNTSFRPKKSLILWAFTAFMLVIGLADVLGALPYRSFWSNFERMEGYVTLLHLYAYFIVVVSVLRTRSIWTWLINTSIGASVIVSAYGFLQLYGKLAISRGSNRLDGTFGNATYLAVYILFHIFFIFLMFGKFKGRPWIRSVYVLLAIAEGYILFQTATRGAILGLAVGLIVTLIVLSVRRSEGKRLRIYAGGALVSILLIGSAFFVFRDSSFVQGSLPLKRVSNISLTEQTVRSRFMVWDIAVEGFKEKPILGWGQENFRIVFDKYYNPEMFDQEPWFDRAHNIIFDWLVAGGALGLLSYLAVIAALIYILIRPPLVFSAIEQATLLGVIAAYMFHNLFVFDNTTSYLLFGMVLAYVHVRSTEEDSTDKNPREFSIRSQQVMGVASVVMVVIVLYFFNVRGIATAQTIIDAIQQGASNHTKSTELFDKALSYNTFGNAEIRDQMIRVANEVNRSRDVDQTDKEKYITNVHDEIKIQIGKSPDDVRLYLLVSGLLNSSGRYAEAAPYLEKALSISPNKQLVLFANIDNLIARGETERALSMARHAFEIAPRNDEARLVYGAVAIRNEKIELAESILEPKFDSIYIPDGKILAAFASIEDYESVAILWEKHLENNPNDTQAYISLAATYVRMGDREKAIEIIRSGSEVDPQLRRVGEKVISDIESGKLR